MVAVFSRDPNQHGDGRIAQDRAVAGGDCIGPKTGGEGRALGPDDARGL